LRVLIVSYHFPPDSEVGGVRPHQIARYLPDFGIEPWVLTVEDRFAESPNAGLAPVGVPEHRIIRTAIGPTLYDRVKSLWRVARPGRRARAKEPAGAAEHESGYTQSAGSKWASYWLGFPDWKYGWYRPALRAANDAMSRVGFDAVVSTSPPRVAALIAESLSRRYRVPWVMDLRDPWWGWYLTATSQFDRQPVMDLLQRRLFRRCVSRASLVVHNTERLRQLTCRLIPGAASKTRCVPNGCAPESEVQQGPSFSPLFRVGHYGQFMGPRSPAVFLRGLREWLDSRRGDASDVRVRLVGSGFGAIRAQLDDLGLQDAVELCASIPRQLVPSQMAGDYVLLLVANAQPLQVPGKCWEYLAAGRRVIAIAEHDGATSDLLKPLSGCIVAERVEEVRAALERFYADYKAGAAAAVDRGTLIRDIGYPRRAEQFAELLREAAAR
jgi:glycosyltransferase involved in cell wall biosynthesis